MAQETIFGANSDKAALMDQLQKKMSELEHAEATREADMTKLSREWEGEKATLLQQLAERVVELKSADVELSAVKEALNGDHPHHFSFPKFF